MVGMRPALLLLFLADASAYLMTPPPALPRQTRREWLSASSGALLAAAAFPGATVASGGATAGKTTSIPRAKVRYYGRISTAVAAFDALALSVKEGDLKGAFAKAFFDESVDSPPDNESPYNAFKTAGYLLAVAFKIDSKIPPDKIPQVKDYKKFMKDLEKLKEAVGRGKVSDSQSAYASVKESLNVLLDGVELPPVGDQKYSEGGGACVFYKGACT